MIAPSSFLIPRSLPALLVLLAASPALAQDEDKRPAAAVQDNSFLIEEAYNQEEGVVQHILNARRRERDWFATFTQEWPVFSQTHQFSYTVPYSGVHGDDNTVARGFGDLMLNYRLQVLMESDTLPAFAPRVSAILPSGSESRGLGTGTAGWQINLPLSKIVADRWTLHGNAGMTLFPNSHGRSPTGFNLGGSVIHAVTPEFNLMLEALHEWEETASEGGVIDRERRWTLSPGFRHAINMDGGQLVLGAAAPIGFSSQRTPDYGLFFYVSFEHDIFK